MEPMMLGSRNMLLERLKFQITDDKPIMDQLHIYEKLVFDILAKGMEMCEILQANILIEKLLKSCGSMKDEIIIMLHGHEHIHLTWTAKPYKIGS
ncbi:hypothetical protein J1N35_043459 [Gossypium stocksii]|uniref:Uncharacterized protein n=1 Tax=Gossypium stocksii TaxID=47602 RepID=A0A9D3U7B1_9ROSI|nr:hypothetical protein J1N35_043459 [Gossypium stocksii]